MYKHGLDEKRRVDPPITPPPRKTRTHALGQKVHPQSGTAYFDLLPVIGNGTLIESGWTTQ